MSQLGRIAVRHLRLDNRPCIRFLARNVPVDRRREEDEAQEGDGVVHLLQTVSPRSPITP